MCHGLLELKTNGIKKWMPRRLFSLVLSVPPDRTKDKLFSDSNSTEDSSCTKKKGGAERKPGMARMCAERESVTHVVWYKTRCVGAIPSYLCLCVCMYVYRHIFLPLQTHCGQDEKKRVLWNGCGSQTAARKHCIGTFEDEHTYKMSSKKE